MALPAGRYGVTKNQLLKIKKLPMNTIKLIEEIQEELDTFGTAVTHDSTSVVTQSTDLVESGAVKDIVGWGNKNLFLPNPGSSTANISYVRNNDYSVTFTGKSNGTTRTPLIGTVTLPVGHYIASGISGGSNNTYALRLNSASLNAVTWYDGEQEFTLEQEETVSVIGRFSDSQTTDFNVTMYPMIRKATITDATYEPYHASVEESLEQKCDNSVIGTVEDGTNPTKAYAVGEHMIRGGKFCTVTVPVTTASTWVEGSNYTSGDVAEMLAPPKLLPNNANLNNYITEGEYFAGAGTYSNCPISDMAFRFKVMPFNVEASRCIQIIYANKTEPEIYMRTNFGGTWQSWYKFTGTVVS